MTTVVPIVSDITLAAAEELFNDAAAHLIETADRSVRILVGIAVPDATTVHIAKAGAVTISMADLDLDADPTLTDQLSRPIQALRAVGALPRQISMPAPTAPSNDTPA